MEPQWITSSENGVNNPNTWIAFRKDITLDMKPDKALTQIAVDSKYWLWINGELVVFEGGLKRGPNPQDMYYDEIDLAPYLKAGENKIAILVWYFGKEGFSHKDSGKAGLLFKMIAGKTEFISDASWICRIHPAYEDTGEPLPNWRLPESNIRFVAEKEIPGWQTFPVVETTGFNAAVEAGPWGCAPWNRLIKRPIPFWKDFGVKTAAFVKNREDNLVVYTASLPYNMQMTPVLDITDDKGGQLIYIETDYLYGGSEINLRAEYVTATGTQHYESLGWLNGQKIIIKCPEGVKVNSIGYRETGYDTEPEGYFSCDNEFYMRFWEKALRTLYVNMRDSYFDCPDRERAQWWGDVVVLMGESFYTYSTSAHALMRKAILELAGWQREDSTLYSPVPAGNYHDELPAQMLASIGQYGFWNYYMNTGDRQTVTDVYPAVKKYLGIWKLDETGLTEFRSGGWSWGDWGEQIDIRLILAGWHYLALEAAANMADLLGYEQDITGYRELMEQVKSGFNQCWNGTAYRHPQYEGETDDRVQALAVISGIAGKEIYEKLFKVFNTQWYASPYMEKYVMEALFQMGYGEYAMERIQKRFGPMVKDESYTTLFEGWEVGGYGGGTTNHAWSGGALTVIAQYLCGITPLEAGYKTFRIAPDPVLFNTATIAVPTVAGTIQSGFIKEAGKFTLKVSVPKHTTALISLPECGNNQLLVNGRSPSGSQLNPDESQKEKGKLHCRLEAGEYVLTVE